ncbi:MAG TPA: L,D-transpeptidase [Ktedonobacteraceae bacterium]|jgi:lipoprotein-anchoring transpeptidase ErfK/SrfK|nr:L,D-transpeptidase [Ktedonobacteraceae bacterium]
MTWQHKRPVLLGLFALLLAISFAINPIAGKTSYAKATTTTASHVQGKLIVVSLSRQWLYAYENGASVFNTAVMTGRDSLPTPTGTYSVFNKLHPTWFTSPWPQGSANWYPPTYINYALEWKAGGFFLHDASWHSTFGPGTNNWHHDPQFGWQAGSHGCIAMSYSAAQWLYNWAPIGTTVQING